MSSTGAIVAAWLWCEALAGAALDEGGHRDLIALELGLVPEKGVTTEVRLGDGTRCDILDRAHGWVIEVDWARKAGEGLLQADHYARQSGLTPALALIVTDAQDLARANDAVAAVFENYKPGRRPVLMLWRYDLDPPRLVVWRVEEKE